MIAERTYWVGVPDGDEPFEVRVAPVGDAWSITVRRGEDSSTFELSEGAGEGRVWIDGRPTTFHFDASGEGPARLALDGVVHALEIATEAEHRLAALGLGAAGGGRAREIRAPMPGLVLDVEVEDGAEVAAGQGVLIIEAMKMENEVTAPIAGRISDLVVTAGEAVEQGALLCRVEPPEEES